MSKRRHPESFPAAYSRLFEAVLTSARSVFLPLGKDAEDTRLDIYNYIRALQGSGPEGAARAIRYRAVMLSVVDGGLVVKLRDQTTRAQTIDAALGGAGFGPAALAPGAKRAPELPTVDLADLVTAGAASESATEEWFGAAEPPAGTGTSPVKGKNGK